MTRDKCPECGAEEGYLHKMDCGYKYRLNEVEDEEDFLSGVSCNPDAPEECESCQ